MNRTILLLALLLAAGCAQKTTSETPPPKAKPVATRPVTPAFVGKVWRVTESSAVSPGTTYEFREGGTLVVTTPGSPPLEGSWAWNAGALTMTEESVTYPTDILSLTDSTFAIRSHNPGTPVDIRMVRSP